jgi:hypothetical protein
MKTFLLIVATFIGLFAAIFIGFVLVELRPGSDSSLYTEAESVIGNTLIDPASREVAANTLQENPGTIECIANHTGLAGIKRQRSYGSERHTSLVASENSVHLTRGHQRIRT